MKVTFTVPGEPKGKGRPRFRTYKSKYSGMPGVPQTMVRTYTPEATASYEDLVKVEFSKMSIQKYGQVVCIEEDPIAVHIKAYFAIPKSTSKKRRALMLSGSIRPTKKSDIDNICKIVLDGLNKTAYKDDKQVVEILVRKWYAEDPRVEVLVSNEEE